MSFVITRWPTEEMIRLSLIHSSLLRGIPAKVKRAELAPVPVVGAVDLGALLTERVLS